MFLRAKRKDLKMAKFNLGEKMGKGIPVTEKNKTFFPSIHVSKSLPKGFEVGQGIHGSFNGKIVSISEDANKASFRIDVMSIDMEKGKVSVKEFEKMSDDDQDKVMSDSVEGKGGKA